MVPFYLQRLGLDAGATERDVRRAYARELKIIDQERDAAGFQSLREAYERALADVAREVRVADVPADPVERESLGALAPAAREARDPVAPPPVSSPAPQQFAQQGQQAARTFVLDFRAALEDAAARNSAHWCAVLTALLSEDPLHNLIAREAFEVTLASTLADGWHLGNDVLFFACCDTFGWNEAGRRQVPGPAGGLLGAALREDAVLKSLPDYEQQPLVHLLTLLRGNALETTDSRGLVDVERRLELLATSFKNLVFVTADAARLRELRAKAAAVPAWEREALMAGQEWSYGKIDAAEGQRSGPFNNDSEWPRTTQRTEPRKTGYRSNSDHASVYTWLIMAASIALIRALFAYFGHSTEGTSATLSEAPPLQPNPVRLAPVEPGASAPVASAGWQVISMGKDEHGRSIYWAFPAGQ